VSIWEAILLGLVEGITEYLPVSSTGHLLVTQRLLGIPENSQANAYAICIQAGAIVAVLELYRTRVAQIGRGLLGQDPAGRRLAVNILAAFVPAGVFGVLLKGAIARHLFQPWPIVFAWIVGGLAILWLERSRLRHRKRALDLESLAIRGAFLIGLMQCIALVPGTSRSLVTIVGGVMMGLSVPAALEFSFLLGLVTLSAATVYEGASHADAMIASFGWPAMLAGFVAAWLSALAAVRWATGYLHRHGLAIFGYWRLLAGGIVAVLLVAGVI
jgi:undecaprenyl-diphosphatase